MSVDTATIEAPATPETQPTQLIEDEPPTEAPRRLSAVVNRDLFEAALREVMLAVSSKAIMPVLGCVKLVRDEDGLTLSATNLEIGIVRRVAVEDTYGEDDYGAVCIPARKLAHIFAGLVKGDTVSLSQVAENALWVDGLRSQVHAKLIGLAAAEYPAIPDSVADLVRRGVQTARPSYEAQLKKHIEDPRFEEPAPIELDPVAAMAYVEQVNIPVALLKRVLRQVLYAAAKDDKHPVFTGVYLHRYDGRLRMVSADSFRLAICAFGAVASDDFAALIPASTLATLAKLLAGKTSGTVEVFVPQTKGQALISFEGGHLITNLLVGTFPDYCKIEELAQDHTTTVDLMSADLALATTTAMRFARETGNVVTFAVTKDTLTMKASDDEENEIERSLAAGVAYVPYHQHDPKALPETLFYLNGEYARQFAAAVATPRVRLTTRSVAKGEKAGPVVFMPTPNNHPALGYELTYLVMPMYHS